MRRMLVGIVVASLAGGCGREAAIPRTDPALESPHLPGGSDRPGPAPGTGGNASEGGCPDLFAEDRLPTYRVEISPAEWAKLEDEFLHREAREAAGLDPNPWHPVVFRHEDEVVDTAMIRLKGQSSWDLAVALDPDPKMQFVLSFNELDKRGRFHGLRKIVLDMPRNDRT
jgi:hypothetical protein